MEPIGTVRWGARAAAMMGMPMLVWPMMVRSSPSSAVGCGAIVIGCGAAAIGGTKGSAVAVGIGMLVIGVAIAIGMLAIAIGIGAAVAVAIGIAWA